MDKLLLKEIALEQKSMQKSIDRGIPRDQLASLKKYVSMPHTVVISGMRRVGKSTLLAQIMDQYYKSEVYYFNFEDERLLNFQVEDFNHLYEILIELFGERKIFFFDEIQNTPHWEVFVRRMQDKGYKFFITGSNASLLSKELGTRLTGRNIVLALYPFSFREFLQFKGVDSNDDVLLYTSKRGKIKRYFREYLEHGGIPEYHKYQDPVLLKRVYEDILYRNIVARHDIKDVKRLRELGLYFLSNAAGLFSYNNLKKILQFGSDNTVRRYTSYMEESYLIFTIPRFSYSLKKQFVAHKKVYCIDNGIMRSVAFRFSKNKGAFLENLVFIELRRKDNEIFYYRTVDHREVDFLIKDGPDKISLIQVTEGLSDQKVRDREVNALLGAMEELSIRKALILTEDFEEEIKVNKKTIKVLPIYKWLLS